MFRMRYAIILALMATAAWAVAAQNTGAATQGNNAQANGPLLRILTPPAGARLAQPFVTVEFELTNPAASPSPNFRVQLDGRDPVITTTTSATFTGVSPGRHSVTVDLVDANNTPLAGGRAQVAFSILPPGPAPAGPVVRLRRPDPVLLRAALMDTVAPVSDTAQALPSAAGALPLLSVIGFGVLLGGIISAMRTR